MSMSLSEKIEPFKLTEKNTFKKIKLSDFQEIIIRDLCMGDYVIKFSLDDSKKAYFAGSTKAAQEISKHHSEVYPIGKLFQKWKEHLNSLGFPQDRKIYNWKVKDVQISEHALETFPGSKMTILDGPCRIHASVTHQEAQG